MNRLFSKNPWAVAVLALAVVVALVAFDGRPGATIGSAALEQRVSRAYLLKNAAEASLERGGGVALRWRRAGDAAVIEIADEGQGISTTDNLFVPFFTTKPGGSGIGLVLARQIAEAHGGSLRLENRRDRTGCIARLELPLRATAH